ncbi:cytochrome c oxidase assembly protein [Rhodopila sp.]|uniref:cytochrome c oxidase assembly protein n=1 Tax=Rhodopila sp. TaxID=2480087 RepID=UPI002C4BFCC7|nr:cytochrome c oxidase assembly protein [Rhodopila sp.]HVZ07496.1 cytochrome c oxidase assembly protein [Rhodopila sp.]
MALLATLLLPFGGPSAALAHGVAAGAERDLRWTLDPWVIVPLVLSAGLYALGVKTLWGRAGWGRGISPRQCGLYVAGWMILAAALISPLHELGEHLFTAHMVEHELVMAAAAPLLVLARPLGAFLWALPQALRHGVARACCRPMSRRTWRALTAPMAATVAHGVAIWVWHVPSLFDAAVADVTLHRLQHLSFLVTALLFWWAMVRRTVPGAAVLHLFATMAHMTMLGALIALAPHPLYLRQTAGAAICGLTPLEDQQLAGLVMWVPAGTVYAGAALAFATLWIRRSGERARAVGAVPLG